MTCFSSKKGFTFRFFLAIIKAGFFSIILADIYYIIYKEGIIMEYTYSCSGTCSRSLQFRMDENHIVTDVTYSGGCNGNLKGIARLCEGMKAEELIDRLEGTKCGFKNTSCPDQLAKALRQAIANAG